MEKLRVAAVTKTAKWAKLLGSARRKQCTLRAELHLSNPGKESCLGHPTEHERAANKKEVIWIAYPHSLVHSSSQKGKGGKKRDTLEGSLLVIVTHFLRTPLPLPDPLRKYLYLY